MNFCHWLVENVGIMILVQVLYLMETHGNSLKWKNSDQNLKMIENKEVRRCTVQKVRTRRNPDQEVRTYPQVPCLEGAVPRFTHSNEKKRAHMGFIMFGPWYLAH